MNEVAVEVEAEVNPTEDPEKVKTAIRNVLGDLGLEQKQTDDRTSIIGKSEGIAALEKFQNLLRRERILNAARNVMFKGLAGKTVTFYLNKQVAFVGHISFSQPEKESPLGPIEIEISCDNPKELINWLTPKTA